MDRHRWKKAKQEHNQNLLQCTHKQEKYHFFLFCVSLASDNGSYRRRRRIAIADPGASG